MVAGVTRSRQVPQSHLRSPEGLLRLQEPGSMIRQEGSGQARTSGAGTDVACMTVGSVRRDGQDFESRAQVEGTLTGEVGLGAN